MMTFAPTGRKMVVLRNGIIHVFLNDYKLPKTKPSPTNQWVKNPSELLSFQKSTFPFCRMELFINLTEGRCGSDIWNKVFKKTSQAWWKSHHTVLLWPESPSVLLQSVSNSSTTWTAFLFCMIWFGEKFYSQMSHFTVEIGDKWGI